MAVLVGVDGEFSEDFSGVAVDDDDVQVVDEHADWGAGVFHAEFDVVHLAAAAQGDGSGGVDGVVSGAEVAAVVVFGGGFGSSGVDLGGSLSVEGAVLAVMVVVAGELV